MIKKKNNNSFILRLLATAFAIAATMTIFLPSLGTSDRIFSGLEVTFGVEIADFLGIASGSLVFSIIAFLAYFLPLIAALLLLFANTKFASLISTVVLIASFVLLIIMTNYIGVEVSIFGNNSIQSIAWDMQWGLIAALFLVGISALISLFTTYKEIY